MKLYSILIFMLVISVIISANNSNITLIENNSSEYKIVISSNPTKVERYSAEEMQKYLQKISNVKLDIIEDSVPASQNEIVIGNTNRNKEIGIDVASLEDDGYSISTADKKLSIIGGKVKGTLYGVYTFLEKYQDCKMYAPGIVEVPEKNMVIIPQINLIEIPAIKYRELHIPFARSSQEYCDWHKLHNYKSVRQKKYGSFVHTFERLVPSDVYFEEHPEYFSEINGNRIPHQQLCLTNHEIYKIVVEELKKAIKERPEAQVWDVSQNDNFGFCTCKKCSYVDSVHQSNAGTMIQFVNKIAREFPNKTISTLAYQYTRKAPVNLKPEPNVMVVLCTIECDRSKPIAQNKDDLFNRDIKEWSAISNNIKIWDYVVQFSSLIDLFPNFHVLQPNAKMFVEHGVKSLFEQGSGDHVSDLHELKAYVLSKLMWNPNENVENIIKEFLKGYYGNASKYLEEYFNIRQNALEKSGKGLIIYGHPSDGIESYMTPQLLQNHSKLFDKAEQAVADKPDYLKRVKYARLPVEFAMLENAKLHVSDDLYIFKIVDNKVVVNPEMKDRVNNFVRVAKDAGIRALHERGKSPDEYYKEMQKYFNEGMMIHKAYKKDVKIYSELTPRYSAKGEQTLTDGTTGEANFTFNWLGFEETEFEAVIDLGEEINISAIRTNFLQEVKSWIWLPKKVKYYVSNDGNIFSKVGEVINTTDEKKTEIFTQPFNLNIKSTKARFIKVETESLINCPIWHIGYNNGTGKAWVFIDEIIVN